MPGEDRSAAGELARILGAAGITVRTGVTAGAVELGGSAGQLAEPRGGGYAAPYGRKPCAVPELRNFSELVFLCASGCSPVLADQAVDDGGTRDPGSHIDRLAGLVQRRSLFAPLVRPIGQALALPDPGGAATETVTLFSRAVGRVMDLGIPCRRHCRRG